MFQGIGECIKSELTESALYTMQIKVPSRSHFLMLNSQSHIVVWRGSSLRFWVQELTERVTAVCMNRVFHDTSPNRFMKCDAGIREETCTYVVLSGDTIMFPGFGERVPNELTVSALYTMQFEVICLPE